MSGRGRDSKFIYMFVREREEVSGRGRDSKFIYMFVRERKCQVEGEIASLYICL